MVGLGPAVGDAVGGAGGERNGDGATAGSGDKSSVGAEDGEVSGESDGAGEGDLPNNSTGRSTLSTVKRQIGVASRTVLASREVPAPESKVTESPAVLKLRSYFPAPLVAILLTGSLLVFALLTQIRSRSVILKTKLDSCGFLWKLTRARS